MRRLALPLALAAVLALPAAAQAKEVTALVVCGTNGCHTIRDKAVLLAFMNQGVQAAAPDRHAPFYSITAKVSEPGQGEIGHFTSRWVPSENRVRSVDENDIPQWNRLKPVVAHAMLRAVHGLKPKPASRLGRLTAPPPAAKVTETFQPAAKTAAVSRAGFGGGGADAWPWIAGAAALCLAIAAAGAVARRRRRS